MRCTEQAPTVRRYVECRRLRAEPLPVLVLYLLGRSEVPTNLLFELYALSFSHRVLTAHSDAGTLRAEVNPGEAGAPCGAPRPRAQSAVTVSDCLYGWKRGTATAYR